MALFNRAKAMLDIDFDKLCDAFIYRAIYMNIKEPQKKLDEQYHGEIYGEAIDLYFVNEQHHIIVQLANWLKDTVFQPYIAIHQSNKVAIDIETVYKGMDKKCLNTLSKRTSLSEYEYIFLQ